MGSVSGDSGYNASMANGNAESTYSDSAHYEQPWLNDPGQWQEVSAIGSGAYGTVMKGYDRRHPGRMVAIKKIRIPIDETGMPQSVVREISILRRIEASNHPNIIKLLDVCHGLRPDARELYLHLVFEYCDSDLAYFMHGYRSSNGRGLPHDIVRKFSHQLLRAVEFLHSHAIIHRDIKPQNILVTSDQNLKLTDYGLARVYSYAVNFTTVVVTLWYRSPDVLLESSYTSSVDIWSVGCIIAEMFINAPLLPGTSEVDQLNLILELTGTPPPAEWPPRAILPMTSFPRYPGRQFNAILAMAPPEAVSLVQWLLRFCSDHRPSAAAALRHPYFVAGAPAVAPNTN